MQVKAFARIDGLILAAVWLLSMWLTLKQPESSWGLILMLSTPFFIGWRLKSFRDGALDGLISFRRGLCFSCYVFFYASLLFALGQLLYFKFLDNGSFMTMFTQGVEIMKPVYEQNKVSIAELDEALKMIQMMTPVDMIFVFMMQNLFIGAMASPLIALFYKRTELK